jgi:hypothetical protein
MASKKHPLIGKRVKFVGPKEGCHGSGLNAKIGKEFIVKTRQNNGCGGGEMFHLSDPETGANYGWCYEYELAPVKMNVAELEEQIAVKEKEITEANAEIVAIQAKVDFIKSHNLEEYDEEEYKAYAVLETLGMGDIEKARAIIKILNK